MKLGATSLSVTKPGSARQYAAASGGGGSTTLPDIDTYSHVRFDTINTGTNQCYDVAISPDGTKLFTLERIHSTNARLKQQTLSTAYDISTHGTTVSSLDTNIFLPSGQAYGFAFGDSGNKLYLGNVLAEVCQINLGAAWELGQGRTVVQTIDVGGRCNGIFWKPDGTVFYWADDMNNRLYSSTVSTAWDLSTITSTNTSVALDTTSTINEGAPWDLHISNDGLKLYICGAVNDKVWQYNLSTAWDITSFSGAANKVLNVTSQETAPTGIDFSSNGTHLYVAGTYDDGVDQYSSP